MQLTNNHDDDKTQELIDLFESYPDNYKHLQVFLHRERPDDSHQDYEFLMVTPMVFGKVRILNVSVVENFIILEFKDCSTKLVGNVRIDINDNNPQTFFICWQDIRKMVMEETSTNISNDELLDFEF